MGGRYHGSGQAQAQRGAAARRPPLRALAFACTLAAGAAPAAPVATVVIRGDRAWMPDDAKEFHVEGGLYVRSERWEIRADEGVVTGALADPDRITARGAPARIIVHDAGGGDPVEGQADALDLDPRAKTLQLEGQARIVRGPESATGGSIRYLLDRRTLSTGSGGEGGRVRVVRQPR